MNGTFEKEKEGEGQGRGKGGNTGVSRGGGVMWHQPKDSAIQKNDEAPMKKRKEGRKAFTRRYPKRHAAAHQTFFWWGV